MAPETISHQEEINTIRKLLNSRIVVQISAMLVSIVLTWLTAGATYSAKVDKLENKMDEKAQIDSINYEQVVNYNEALIGALEASNNAVINLNKAVDRLNIQVDYMQRDIEFIRKKIDK